MSLFPFNIPGLFINNSASRAAQYLVEWGNQELVGRRTTLTEGNMTLEHALKHVSERSAIPCRGILVPLTNKWTAFFDNDLYQSMPQSEMYILCLNLKCDVCFFSYNIDVTSPHRGSIRFCYYRYTAGNVPVSERSVSLDKESQWVFQESGEPLKFERVEVYREANKANRLTPGLLYEYGKALDLPFWELTKYGNDVKLLTWGSVKNVNPESAIQKFLGFF